MHFRGILSLLLIVSLFSCKKEENPKSPEIQNLDDIYHYIDGRNQLIVRKMKKYFLDGGSRPSELYIIESSEEILKKRQSFSFDTIAIHKELDDYTNYISQQFKRTRDYDSTLINRVKYFLKELEKNRDKSVYKNLILTSLLIEEKLLEFYAMQIGGDCSFFAYARTTKQHDTISVGDPYVFAVPEYFNSKLADIESAPGFTFQLNGQKKVVPYSTEIVGGVIIVRPQFKEKGHYRIDGIFNFRSKKEDYVWRNAVIDQVYVK